MGGINRNLTPVFVKFRGDFKAKKNRFGSGLLGGGHETGHQRLLTDDNDDMAVEMSSLPPTWVDTSDDAKALIAKLKDRINVLRKAHQKRLRQVFKDDDVRGDQEIQSLSTTISDLFRDCEAKIREIQTKGADMGMTNKDYGLRQNVQRSLATQLQQLSQQFRKYQKSYLEELQKRDKGTWGDEMDLENPNNMNSVDMTDAQILATEQGINVTQRSEEISKIAKSITDLHTIFKELAVLVIDQGTILDRIDYNVEQVVYQSREANVQLGKAREHKKSNRARKCIMFLIAGNTLLLLLNFIKFRNG